MSDNILKIIPLNPESSTTLAKPDLIKYLKDIKLINEKKIVTSKEYYNQGDQFLSLIKFHGFHTVIELGKVGNDLKEINRGNSYNYCTIEVEFKDSGIHFLGGGNTQSPFCINCNYCIEDWMSLMSEWYDNQDTYVWKCPDCSNTYKPWEFDWKQTNGFGNKVIKIWGVYENEAIPSDILLDGLKDISNIDWKYFYFHF